nr:hypothetical protein [Tanacetum cinerariifolium]
MFDEYFNPPTIAISPVPVAAIPRTVDLADLPVSMSIDQDAPSTSITSSQQQEHSLIISQEQEPTEETKDTELQSTKHIQPLTISKPTGVAKNVFVKVGKFYFPADFIVLDFIADPCVPFILGRPFLSTAHAIINVHEREIILRQDQQSLTIQCGDISSIKKVKQINKIDFIDAGGRDFDLEEIENFLNDDSIPIRVEDSPFNMEEDILFLEGLLIEDPFPPHPIIPNQTKSPIKEPKNSFKIGVKFDNLDEFSKPIIPIHIVEEERIRREHTDYINRIEMLFTINPRPHPSTYANTNVESFSSLSIPIQESDPHQEEIDVVTSTDDVLPKSVENDDSDGEEVVVDDLRIDNSISNSEHEFSESEDSDFDNPSIPLPPPKPSDEEFDFKSVFSVVGNTIVRFECIDARVKFDVFNDENDDLSYFMFVIFAKVFSLLFAKSEDTIFDHGKFYLWMDDNESHNHNLQAILTNGIASCSIPSDEEYVEGFCDQ